MPHRAELAALRRRMIFERLAGLEAQFEHGTDTELAIELAGLALALADIPDRARTLQRLSTLAYAYKIPDISRPPRDGNGK